VKNKYKRKPYSSLNSIQRQPNIFNITKLFYFSASGSSCHALGLTYTNNLFDLLASNVFHRTASISSRSTKSTFTKSEERGGQTFRPLDQQTEIQKRHSALQILQQTTRRPAPIQHNSSLDRHHEHWEVGIVPAYMRHAVLVKVF